MHDIVMPGLDVVLPLDFDGAPGTSGTRRWLPDAAMGDQVLVGNPMELYGFGE